jgi:hypothetical protein
MALLAEYSTPKLRSTLSTSPNVDRRRRNPKSRISNSSSVRVRLAKGDVALNPPRVRTPPLKRTAAMFIVCNEAAGVQRQVEVLWVSAL